NLSSGISNNLLKKSHTRRFRSFVPNKLCPCSHLVGLPDISIVDCVIERIEMVASCEPTTGKYLTSDHSIESPSLDRETTSPLDIIPSWSHDIFIVTQSIICKFLFDNIK